MIAILVCDKNEQERSLISMDCRKRIAEESNQELRVDYAADDQDR